MYKVFVLEDNLIDLSLIEAIFKNDKHDFFLELEDNPYDIVNKIISFKPHIILLDIILPNTNGIELCKNINSNSITKNIPIIFLTSKTEPATKIQAFKSGAVDYITKPINKEEIIARSLTHIELYNTRKALETYAENMERLANDKAKQLIHSERMAALGLLSAGIVHEINNPTSFISGNISILRTFWKKFIHLVHKYNGNLSIEKMDIKDFEKIQFIIKETDNCISSIYNGIDKITSITQGLNSFARQKETIFEKCLLKDCIKETLILCHNKLKQKIELIQKIDKTIKLYADKKQIEQVLLNLIINACDALEKVKEPKIIITSKTNKKYITLIIEDNGPGFKDIFIENIWNPFFTTKPLDKGTGLGLSISAGIIKTHKGTITAQSKKEGGAKFIITLPNCQTQQKGN